MPASASSSLSPLFRDLATGLNQQMFFWGQDAVHPEGNLFVRLGFEKRPSTGLQGTSCYRFPWQEGAIELHGSYAGWIGGEGGMFFIRPLHRCVRWLDGTPPVPGKWPRERYSSKSDEFLYAAARPFLDWWLKHEDRVLSLTGKAYRDTCHRNYGKQSRTRTWLRPDLATRWVTGFRDHPESLPRVRRFTENVA